MIAKAELRYVRITPRKFRQIIPLVKGKNPEIAIEMLGLVKKKASGYAIDLLKSAIANAKNRHEHMDASSMFISRFVANCGPALKRFRAASMGRASMIKKRTSHLIVELDAPSGAMHKASDKKAAAKVVKPKVEKKPAHAPAKATKVRK